MTHREMKDIEAMLGNVAPAGEPPAMDAEALSLALRTVDQLDESIENVETTLQSLGLLFEDFTLQKALIGAVGISVTEIRSQIPALREAAKEAGE